MPYSLLRSCQPFESATKFILAWGLLVLLATPLPTQKVAEMTQGREVKGTQVQRQLINFEVYSPEWEGRKSNMTIFLQWKLIITIWNLSVRRKGTLILFIFISLIFLNLIVTDISHARKKVKVNIHLPSNLTNTSHLFKETHANTH